MKNTGTNYKLYYYHTLFDIDFLYKKNNNVCPKTYKDYLTLIYKLNNEEILQPFKQIDIFGVRMNI